MMQLHARASTHTPTSAPRTGTCGHQLAQRRYARTSPRAAAGAATDTQLETAAALKADIIRLSGTRYGHDLSQDTRQQVEAAVKQLEGLQLPVKVDMGLLTGTVWTTVYTTSTGTSSGKVGPFITNVVQDFPASEPGVYDNISTLGFVSAKLRGQYSITRDDRIDLEFQRIKLSIGPFQAAEKVFAPGAMRGYWKMSYCDADFRVFYTNKSNLFVLRRLSTP